MAKKYLLGCDVGGTFTDLILLDATTSQLVGRCKTPSTPEDQSIGVDNGINEICKSAGVERSQIQSLLHGTTVATNAILEGKGAKVGLISTAGYRQVLHIDRSFVPGGLAAFITWNQPELLATLENTIEVKERMDAFGAELRPVDMAHLTEQLQLLKANKVETVAVSLMNAYMNGAHELQVKAAVEQVLPGISVTLSHEVLPEMYEYERASTTVANGVIRPKVQSYVSNLEAKLGEAVDFKILRSDGGLSSKSTACQYPVNLLMSGPAGGVEGAAWVCGAAGYKNLLTLDMGGTSTDVAVVIDGKVNTRRETRVGDVVVRVQALDVHTVGAGGGSVAKVPEFTKALRVGPESAGASPGPACYGKGGDKPAVSDANAVLGNLPKRGLIGGGMALAVDAAIKAVAPIGEALGMSTEAAAEGIIDVVNENMCGALRVVSVEKGYDPREFALVPFGGAGALHACAIAKVMGSWPVVVPPNPGLLCALGDVTTIIKDSRSCSFVKALASTSTEEITKKLEELMEAACGQLVQDGIPKEDQSTVFEVDMRFAGQGLSSCLTIKATLEKLRSGDGLQWIAGRLEEEHKRAFTFSFTQDHEIVNLRCNVQGKPHGVILPEIAVGEKAPPAAAKISTQDAFYGGKKIQTSVYERLQLLAGNEILGPAIILDMDSTTLVIPGCLAKIDKFGMIVITPAADDCPRHVVNSAPDKITLEVVENALKSARYEMDAVVYRTAMSPGIREQHDQFPVIAGPDGKMVMGQFGSFIPAFLRTYKEPIEEGDVILLNDPYSCDGAVSHLNDWLIMQPIFVDGERVGWASMFGHMTDVGGMCHCSMPNDAREIYQEGILIPPVKLWAKGVFNKELHDLILHNCRMPQWNKCDLQAIVASCELCKIRIIDLCNRFGKETYKQTLDMMLQRNYAATHAIIQQNVSEDEIYFEDYSCDDGQGCGPYKLACKMKKVIQKDSGEHHVVFDFSETDPQSPGSLNFYLNVELFKMFVGSYLCAVFDPQMVFNDGFYPLLDVNIPKGCLLNPEFPAALSCRTHLLGRVFDVIGGLLGQRAPKFMCAAGFSDSPHLQYYGDDDGSGKPFMYYGIAFGGIPGKPFGDGPDGHSLWPSFTNVPNEFMERYFPVRVEACETIADSGGAGFFRGGNGIRLVYRLLADGAINIHDDRWWIKPWGVNGGQCAEGSRKILYRGCREGEFESPTKELVPSKCDKFPVKKGDVLHFITWGGGGYGKPYERGAELVQRDVKRGLVTRDGAKDNYGVVLDDGLEIDPAATADRRKVLSDCAHPEGSEQAIFDFGWKKGIKATPQELQRLRTGCMQMTGFSAPEPHFKQSADGKKTVKAIACGMSYCRGCAVRL